MRERRERKIRVSEPSLREKVEMDEILTEDRKGTDEKGEKKQAISREEDMGREKRTTDMGKNERYIGGR